jgi:hypothetical protein
MLFMQKFLFNDGDLELVWWYVLSMYSSSYIYEHGLNLKFYLLEL